ncbi:MAG: hypothetical protein QXU97_05085 [Fervidicoccaceae archaeon]
MPSNFRPELLARHPARLVEKKREGDKVWSLYFRCPTLPKTEPGQFVMVWLPGSEEIPISPSLHDEEKGLVRLTVAAVGPTSSALCALGAGSLVLLRGPYGRGFSRRSYSRPLLMAGGYGVAPIAFLARRLAEESMTPVICLGAKNSSSLYLLDELRGLGAELLIYTEDGSIGERGAVTDALTSRLALEEVDALMACGPELMLRKIIDIIDRAEKRPSIVELSVERLIRCGVGLCGSCSLGPWLVCRDGPVFSAERLRGTELGLWRRGWAGEVESIS